METCRALRIAEQLRSRTVSAEVYCPRPIGAVGLVNDNIVSRNN